MTTYHSYVLVDSEETATAAIRVLRGCHELSVDCEGVQLGRFGELCLVQVSTSTTAYLFDILMLRERVFDLGK